MFVKILLSSFCVLALFHGQIYAYALPIVNDTDSSQHHHACLQLLEDNCLPNCVSDIPDKVKNFQVPLREALSKEHKDCLKTCVQTNKSIFESEGCFPRIYNHQDSNDDHDDDSEENEAANHSRKRRNETSCTEIGGYWTGSFC
eukprot:Awhi_evm1s2095